MLIIKLIPDVVDGLCMISHEPFDVFHVVVALSVIEGFELVPHHRGDVIHRNLSSRDTEVFHPGTASGAAEAAWIATSAYH